MKPNFKEMTKQELIAYIKEHRTDDEAIHELFVNRRRTNAIKYPAEQTQAEIEQILRDKLKLDKT
jgi:hypothetical protein